MGEEQTVKAFIERWGNSGAAERANCQSFLSELRAALSAASGPVTAEELARMDDGRCLAG